MIQNLETRYKGRGGYSSTAVGVVTFVLLLCSPIVSIFFQNSLTYKLSLVNHKMAVVGDFGYETSHSRTQLINPIISSSTNTQA